MGNFFTDNQDIMFLFNHMDLGKVATLMEENFRFADEYDYAPRNTADAIDNYKKILTSLGDLTANQIAPTAEQTDQIGNVLNEDGSVTYAPGIAAAVESLGKAGLMGFTLPYKYGGINCPNLIYTMSNDIVSRADASLMNLYGLQGIAETINAYASEEIKQEYLPDMATGAKSGAMVLTEPEAGSDLQSVKVTAHEDENGNWTVQGVKRFITNGCGHVLLVLARSEHDITDGRGLSLFLVERGPKVRVRRLENKLGIHGSPTCELLFDNAPAKLVGDRKQGLITYVMSLMYGARIGIAAQSLGIAEAAYRVARDYAHKRKQFGTTIDTFPAIRELLTDMSIDLQGARALTYYSSYCVDILVSAQRDLEIDNFDNPELKKETKTTARLYKRYNGILTPISKYYSSEMSIRVCNNAMSVLGGSGYMKDYPIERHLRDSRITTIYEGTTQLQIVAAVGGVTSGLVLDLIGPMMDRQWPEEVMPMINTIQTGINDLKETIAFIKDGREGDYRRLYARKIVDMAITLIIGILFCDHATVNDNKKFVAKHWLSRKMPEFIANKQQICSGDVYALDNFEELAGPVPVLA